MNALLIEKGIYQRIHDNAKRILTEIGMDISASPVLMALLLEADAIDTKSENALFVPIKADYLETCWKQYPGKCLKILVKTLLEPGRRHHLSCVPEEMILPLPIEGIRRDCQDRSRIFRHPGNFSVFLWQPTSLFLFLRAPN